jgi:hypothetical protein
MECILSVPVDDKIQVVPVESGKDFFNRLSDIFVYYQDL